MSSAHWTVPGVAQKLIFHGLKSEMKELEETETAENWTSQFYIICIMAQVDLSQKYAVFFPKYAKRC